MRLVFDTKRLLSADEIHQWISDNLHAESSVSVTHNNTRIIIHDRELSNSELKKLYKFIQEEMDGKLIPTSSTVSLTYIENEDER